MKHEFSSRYSTSLLVIYNGDMYTLLSLYPRLSMQYKADENTQVQFGVEVFYK